MIIRGSIVAGGIQLKPERQTTSDYAQRRSASALIPASFGPPYAGQVFGLIDSKTVQARTFGMSDADIEQEWVHEDQNSRRLPAARDKPSIWIPAEWNYYGGMESSDLAIAVVGVQTGPDPSKVGTDAMAVIGAKLTYSGTITDVNSEGSPPATQFFIDSLRLQNGATTLLTGTASKGACQWLNFYRNVNLTADGGAGGYVYHVMRKSDANTSIKLPGFDDPRIIGVICRYYLYRFSTGDADIETLYKNQQNNPAALEIVGTFAPLFANEKIVTGPVGRLLVANDTIVPTPPGTNNNGGPPGLIALGPAVLHCIGNAISVDFSGTFPDYFKTISAPNLKYDFGPVTLVVSNATGSAPIGPVDYTDTDSGDRRGWIFDFDISSKPDAQKILQDSEAKFSLQHATLGTVLAETDYYFVSNQQGIYAEHSRSWAWSSNPAGEPGHRAVYHRGVELSPAQCPPITVWQYRSVPIQSPGDVESIATNFKPGQPLQVDTSQPGNFLFTFSIGATAGFPPQSYNLSWEPPYITNAPALTQRFPPKPGDDLQRVLVDPNAAAPVGNDQLTFDVVYQKVLRTYYLLYPIMSLVFPLNSEFDRCPSCPSHPAIDRCEALDVDAHTCRAAGI